MNFANETVNKTALDCLSSVTAMSSAPVFAKYYNDCMKAVFNVLNQIKDPTKLEYLSSVVDVMTQVEHLPEASLHSFYLRLALLLERRVL